MAGQPMGTYVGHEMTFRHPGRVSALIVIGGTCITAEPRMAGPRVAEGHGADHESLAI